MGFPLSQRMGEQTAPAQRALPVPAPVSVLPCWLPCGSHFLLRDSMQGLDRKRPALPAGVCWGRRAAHWPPSLASRLPPRLCLAQLHVVHLQWWLQGPPASDGGGAASLHSLCVRTETGSGPLDCRAANWKGCLCMGARERVHDCFQLHLKKPAFCLFTPNRSIALVQAL